MTGHRTHTLIETPVGTLLLAATDATLTRLHFGSSRTRPDPATLGERDDRPFAAVIDQLHAYFDGELTEFDVTYRFEGGTPFQRAVWEALCTIPYGETASYAQIAGRIGRPTATRAVGAANGRNPIGIIVPCHRVIGANGTLTGFGGGLDAKKILLDLEQHPALL